MTRLLNILWLSILTNVIQGQNIFFVEHKLLNDVIPLTSGSYKTILTVIENKDTLRLEDPKIGVHWIPINNNEIIGSQIYKNDTVVGGFLNTIQRIDLKKKKYSTLYASSDHIVCLTTSSNYCYFVLTGNQSNRFIISNLFRINLRDYKIQQIFVPKGINFSHLNVSPNDRWLSFVSSENIESQNNYLERYLLLDLYNYNIIEIDKASAAYEEFFRVADDSQLSHFIDDDDIIYFKKDSLSSDGIIYKYQISSRKLSKYFVVPEKRIESFSYNNGIFFFIESGNKIYKYCNDGVKEYVYECRKQYEFINDCFYVK